jgi:hypothetical protein
LRGEPLWPGDAGAVRRSPRGSSRSWEKESWRWSCLCLWWRFRKIGSPEGIRLLLRLAELLVLKSIPGCSLSLFTVQLSQVAVEARAPYSEDLRRRLAMSSAEIEHTPDVHVANFIKRGKLDYTRIRTDWHPERMILAERVRVASSVRGWGGLGS